MTSYLIIQIMASDNPNVPFGSEEDYPIKTAPYSRDIIDWIKNNIVGPVGAKGDTGDVTCKPGRAAPRCTQVYCAAIAYFIIILIIGCDCIINTHICCRGF